MMLPGGIIDSVGELRRDYAFKPISGELELAFAEGLDTTEPMALQITKALTLILDHIGGHEVDAEFAANLCIADRQLLMRQFMNHLGVVHPWLMAECRQCSNAFDFLIEPHRLPIKPAGPQFPFTEVEIEIGKCRFRTPTGADQCAVADIEDMKRAIDTILNRCLITVDDNPRENKPTVFSEADLPVIEAALAESSPELTTRIEATCPDCCFKNTVSLDPYFGLKSFGESILDDTHTLASNYHWNEADILALPRERRLRYLARIDSGNGIPTVKKSLRSGGLHGISE